MALRIGDLAGRTGASAPTIRFYEEIGLLPRADRQGGGQRRYGEADVRRLTFIRRCRDVGFPIEQVRTLASLLDDRGRACDEARDLAQAQLIAVRARLGELRALESSLVGLVESCDTSCLGGPGPDCVILEDLAEPAAYRVSPSRQRS